jgi:hypothetical protein
MFRSRLHTIFITITLKRFCVRVVCRSDRVLRCPISKQREKINPPTTPDQDIYRINAMMARKPSSLWKNDLHATRPSSVPPESNLSRRSFMSNARLSSRLPHSNSEGPRGNFSEYQSPDSPPLLQRKPAGLDLMDDLHHSGSSVVKTRTGSVLSRGFILKTDHYPSGESLSHC